MQVALYARVSTANQQQEGTISSQITALKEHIARQGWSLLPEHEFLDEGFSGSRLDRPADSENRTVSDDSARCASTDGRSYGSGVGESKPDRTRRQYSSAATRSCSDSHCR